MNGQIFLLPEGTSQTFPYPCSSPFSCHPYNITFPKGFYFLEVYGAQGGNATSGGLNVQGGKGGYSSGIYEVKSDFEILYLYIGATANSIGTPTTNTYNGGGYGQNQNDAFGGGGTDFRKIYGDDHLALQSRILVAGGGGGAYSPAEDPTYSLTGGDGGGILGFPGESLGKAVPCVGSQNGCVNGIQDEQYEFHEGEFGRGAGHYYGGGGGGYWGGGTTASGGAGGSGYFDGVTGSSKWKKILSGVNNGFGWARITYIKFDKNTCHYIYLKYNFLFIHLFTEFFPK